MNPIQSLELATYGARAMPNLTINTDARGNSRSGALRAAGFRVIAQSR